MDQSLVHTFFLGKFVWTNGPDSSSNACFPPTLALVHGWLFSEMVFDLRVRPPGIVWKTGRNPKMGKEWPKNRKWLSARNGEKMAQKWRKDGIWGSFFYFSPFFRQFFPISGRGPFSIFWPFFSHFWIFGPFSILYQAALTRNV